MYFCKFKYMYFVCAIYSLCKHIVNLCSKYSNTVYLKSYNCYFFPDLKLVLSKSLIQILILSHFVCAVISVSMWMK